MMIYDIPERFKFLINKILTCQTKEQFKTETGSEQYDFDEKNIYIAKYIKNLEAEYNGVIDALKAMQERSKNLMKNMEMLQDFIVQDIEQVGLLDPIKCPEFEIKLRNCPPSVIIYDAEAILDCYKVVKETITIDKNAIKKDIQEGFEVDGAKLERNKSLIIK